MSSMMPAAPRAMTADSRCSAPWSMKAAVTATIMAMLLTNRGRSFTASCSERVMTPRTASAPTDSFRPYSTLNTISSTARMATTTGAS